MRGLALAIIGLFATNCFGQTSTFRWTQQGCRYTGLYDTKAISLAELQSTLKLALPGSYILQTNTTVWKYEDISRLDTAALDREYKQKSADLAGLKIVHSDYWEDLRKRKLRELEAVYRLERTMMLGYKDPRALSELKDAPACMTRFGEPLIKGGDALLTAWRTLNEEERKKNVDPERLRRVYEQQLRSPDKLKFAFLDVMTFGWSNCVNDLIPYVDYDGTPEKEFRKLFIKVARLGCDEP